jgi:hypothetical protein
LLIGILRIRSWRRARIICRTVSRDFLKRQRRKLLAKWAEEDVDSMVYIYSQNFSEYQVDSSSFHLCPVSMLHYFKYVIDRYFSICLWRSITIFMTLKHAFVLISWQRILPKKQGHCVMETSGNFVGQRPIGHEYFLNIFPLCVRIYP